MDKVVGQKRPGAHLYAPTDPFDQRMLEVGDGHRVYVEQCGNPDGIPVIVLHGGPGGGQYDRRPAGPAHAPLRKPRGLRRPQMTCLAAAAIC